jgi:hypothetical protein
MDVNAEVEVNKQLEDGERLIWAGAPKQGVLLRASDAFMVPFSLLWCGFAIFWEVSVLAMGGPPFFALFGAIFVLLGVYFVIGRFIVDSLLRAKTLYGLTNRRVIIISGVSSRTINSLTLRTLNDLSVTERSDGSGTVLFGRPNPFATWNAGMPWPGIGQYQTPSFELIQDAKRVYDQILEAQRAAA